MTIYALTYVRGYETGHKELVGVYSTREKAKEAKLQDIEKQNRYLGSYSIHEMQIDKTVNEIYQEW